MNYGNTSLLRKPNKGPTFPPIYCPISLINHLQSNSYKITPHKIHHDQTGFNKGSQSTDNTQRLLNLADYSNIDNMEAVVVSLDAEKAFGRVN